MLSANADHRVLGFLGRALSLEMVAVQQYATQAKLVATWGLAAEANKLQKESLEEMGHVERVISRMLALGVSPGASILRPPRLGTNLHEILVAGSDLERDLVKLYSQATHHCASIGDHYNRMFFEELLKEEQDHGAALTAWIKKLESYETSPPSRDTF